MSYKDYNKVVNSHDQHRVPAATQKLNVASSDFHFSDVDHLELEERSDADCSPPEVRIQGRGNREKLRFYFYLRN